MRHIPLRGLCRALTQRSLVQAPSVWGKLPAYGDFVHHNVSASAQEAWHDWVVTYWHKRPVSRTSVSAKSTSSQGWVHVSQMPERADLTRVPVAFVFPPGQWPQMGDAYVQGVMVASEDKVGRPCPLIIYQTVHRSWMHRTWDSPWNHGHANLPRDDRDAGRHVLFWWARLAARAQQNTGLLPSLVEAVEQVWSLHEPGWRDWLGGRPAPVSQASLAALIDKFTALGGQDAAKPLRGVYHLPWADWPERTLRTNSPMAAFWVQDSDGGYVNASDNMLQLWGVRS